MIDALAQTALVLSQSIAASVLVKTTLIVAVALIASRYARRATASLRHLVLVSAFVVLVVLPLTAFLGPSVTLAIARPSVVAPYPAALPLDDESAAVRPLIPTPRQADRGADRSPRLTLGAVLGAAWVAGALLFLVPLAVTPWRLRQLRRTASPWRQGDALVRQLAAGAGIRRPLAVLVHEAVASPMTCGVVHPAIVLPTDAPDWSPDEIRHALLHELEHIRRADWPVHVAARVVCALYWFHPLAWAAWGRLCLEAERACDDAVVRVAEGTAYAEQLVLLARRRTKASAVPALSMAGRSDLAERIAALLDGRRARGRLGILRASAIFATAATLAAAVAPLRAGTRVGAGQAAGQPAPPRFEVVSVKKNRSGPDNGSMRLQPGGRIVITNQALLPLILFAYGLQPQQLAGAPEWIESDRFDILAQAAGNLVPSPPGGPPGPAQLMLQQLLADRFQLSVHTEARELPVYALTLARSERQLGRGIRPATTNCEAMIKELLAKAASGGGPPAMPQLADGRPACGISSPGPGRLWAGGSILPQLATTLSGAVGRIVQDRTGLTGGFDFELEFAPESSGGAVGAGGTAPGTDRPSLFTALEEQLGLKLQPQRAPIDVLVIDRVEQPTEN